MKNTNKKGFTLVELLVLIAILAILATVAVVGYTSFTDKAHESNDRSLVAQLNTAVLRVDGSKYTNPHEVFEELKNFGFDVSLLKATAENQEILWDMDKQEFFYSADENRSGDHIWMITMDPSKISENHRNYYVGTENLVTNSSQDIWVYTRAGAVIEIDAPNAHVEHYGLAESIKIIRVANATYVENGEVEHIEAHAGRIVLGSKAVVGALVVEKAEKAENAVVVIPEDNSSTGNMIINDEAVVIVYNANATIGTLSSADEAIANKLAEDSTSLFVEDVETKKEVSEEVKAEITEKVEIVTEKVETEAMVYFAGGFGTENAPYLIETAAQLANISKFYDTYKYYRVKDGVTSIDMTGVGRIELNGSFDGNGVKLVNLTTSLFAYVGYQNEVATIKISNLEATLNNTDGHAFVRNIFNAGTTTFENVTLHGYIEGLYNLGSFYNYGTANCDGKGASYTVEFINSKSDMTIACTSGNIAGGFLGHSYEGAGNSFTLKIDANSSYTGTIYTTTGKGNLYFAMTSDYNNALNHFIVNGEEIKFDNGNIPAAAGLGKIVAADPVKGANGYTVTPVAGATTFVVYLNTQVTAYDDEGNKITNKAGMTWTLDRVEMDATEGKVFDLVNDFTIVNGTDKEFGYTLNNGVLTINSARKDNYATGWVTLQVNQYDANGNLLAVGTLKLATK